MATKPPVDTTNLFERETINDLRILIEGAVKKNKEGKLYTNLEVVSVEGFNGHWWILIDGFFFFKLLIEIASPVEFRLFRVTNNLKKGDITETYADVVALVYRVRHIIDEHNNRGRT